MSWNFSPAPSSSLNGTSLVGTLPSLTAAQLNKVFGKDCKVEPADKSTHEWHVRAQFGKQTVDFAVYDYHGERWNIGAQNTPSVRALINTALTSAGLNATV